MRAADEYNVRMQIRLGMRVCSGCTVCYTVFSFVPKRRPECPKPEQTP